MWQPGRTGSQGSNCFDFVLRLIFKEIYGERGKCSSSKIYIPSLGFIFLRQDRLARVESPDRLSIIFFFFPFLAPRQWTLEVVSLLLLGVGEKKGDDDMAGAVNNAKKESCDEIEWHQYQRTPWKRKKRWKTLLKSWGTFKSFIFLNDSCLSIFFLF